MYIFKYNTDEKSENFAFPYLDKGGCSFENQQQIEHLISDGQKTLIEYVFLQMLYLPYAIDQVSLVLVLVCVDYSNRIKSNHVT